MSVDFDALVIGGGPAGLSAAHTLGKYGLARTLLIEREAELGGIPRHCHHAGFGWFDLRRVMTGPSYAKYRTRLLKTAKIECWTETTATDWAGSSALRTLSPNGLETISAKAIVLATGCRERPRSACLVPGSRPHGVFTTGALQQLLYINHQKVGRRAVVIGAEHVSFSALHSLERSRTKVEAMVTELPHHQTYPIFRWLTSTLHRVPILCNARLTQIFGAKRVEEVEISFSTGERKRLACDTVVFTGNWIPSHELPRLAHIEMDDGTEGPRVDTGLRTSREGVFAAGNMLHGAEIADVAAIDGVRAAQSVLEFLKGKNGWHARAIPIETVAPLKWIFPNAIRSPADIPPRNHFILRAQTFLNRVTISVSQQERVLYRHFFNRMVPNRPYYLPSHWISRIDSQNPIVVSL